MDVFYFKAHRGLELELMKSFSHATYPLVQKIICLPSSTLQGNATTLETVLLPGGCWMQAVYLKL